MKRILFFIFFVLLLTGCNTSDENIEGVKIDLSDNSIMVDGKEISNDSTQAVYSANDIIFYLAGQDFTYGAGSSKDEHEQSVADAHTVIHITKPGNYILSGKLSLGQIAVDLGEDALTNPEAVVTIYLNNVDIKCTVAPAIIFYNVYECANTNEETASKDVNTSNAGANVIIVDKTENNINGSYVAKIYESVTLNDDKTEIVDSVKLHKYDGAFYSKQSININGGKKGNGILNINAENEGLNSEVHLTINGGIININSGDDGINTNFDNVSVTTINGGTLNILCNGNQGEGDGIDSNGWLVINGGSLTSQACSTFGDSGIDADKGIYIYGGKVIATANLLDNIVESTQTYIIFGFTTLQNVNTYTLKNSKDKVVFEFTPTNASTYLIVSGYDIAPGEYTFWYGDTQLKGSKTISIQNGAPGGNMPDGGMMPPEGGMPGENMPNGGMMPPEGGMPGGNMPDGGMTPPEGGIPGGNMPDGGMTPPEGGIPGGNINSDLETSTTFIITEGANFFTNISPVE